MSLPELPPPGLKPATVGNAPQPPNGIRIDAGTKTGGASSGTNPSPTPGQIGAGGIIGGKAASELGAPDPFKARANGFPGQRIPSSAGRWTGEVGESGWVSELPEVSAITGGKPIPYKNGFPVFKEWAIGEVKLDKMKGNRTTDFDDADKLFAQQKGWFKNGLPDAKRVEKMRATEDLTWHHVEDKVTMQLVPQILNNKIPHTGGAALVRRGE
jgi:hypothetical protein